MYIPENINTNCGIYRIVNKTNGKFYIGSTKNAKDRKKTHFRELKKGIHHCDHLQRAWNKAEDKSVFKFMVFIFCKEKDLIPLEQSCLDHMLPEYNTNKIAGKPPVFHGPANFMYKNGKKSSFFGKPAWNKNLPKEMQPAYGKPGNMLGRTGPQHPCWGKPAWNSGKPLSDDHKKSLCVAKLKNINKRNPVSKLTELEVRDILASTEYLDFLANRYKVSLETISRILRNKTWQYLPREKVWTVTELRGRNWTKQKRDRQGEHHRGTKHRDAKLTEADVLEIRASNARHVDLAKKYDVSACTILSIRQGATWKHLLPDNFFDSPAENQQPLDWPSKEISAESERFAHGDIL